MGDHRELIVDLDVRASEVESASAQLEQSLSSVVPSPTP
jgi:hypothetical protein